MHYPEERKARKVETWGEIRPSLASIEKLLSNRVKKENKFELEHTSGKYNQYPSLEESECVEVVSEGIVGEVVCTKEKLQKSINDSREGNALEDHDSPEFNSQLKELESLVQGGVPKDLRGEV